MTQWWQVELRPFQQHRIAGKHAGGAEGDQIADPDVQTKQDGEASVHAYHHDTDEGDRHAESLPAVHRLAQHDAGEQHGRYRRQREHDADIDRTGQRQRRE